MNEKQQPNLAQQSGSKLLTPGFASKLKAPTSTSTSSMSVSEPFKANPETPSKGLSSLKSKVQAGETQPSLIQQRHSMHPKISADTPQSLEMISSYKKPQPKVAEMKTSSIGAGTKVAQQQRPSLIGKGAAGGQETKTTNESKRPIVNPNNQQQSLKDQTVVSVTAKPSSLGSSTTSIQGSKFGLKPKTTTTLEELDFIKQANQRTVQTPLISSKKVTQLKLGTHQETAGHPGQSVSHGPNNPNFSLISGAQDQDQSPSAANNNKKTLCQTSNMAGEQDCSMIQEPPVSSTAITKKFGFKGGPNRGSIQTAKTVMHQLSPVKHHQVQDDGLNSIEVQARASIHNHLQNAKLEETIKNLEQNLAALPQGFNRVRERSKLRDRFSTLKPLSQLPEQKQQAPAENPFSVIIEEEQERNLPLSAFLPSRRNTEIPMRTSAQQPYLVQKLNSIQGQVKEKTQPLFEKCLEEELLEEEDEMLIEDQDLKRDSNEGNACFDDLEDQLLSDEGEPNPFGALVKSTNKSRVGGMEVLQPKGMPKSIEEVKTTDKKAVPQDKPKERVSLTAQFKQKNKLAQRATTTVTSKKLTQDFAQLNLQQTPLVAASNVDQISAERPSLAGSQVIGHHQGVKIGLNACQRQGPAITRKKAFEHKKKRFATTLDATGETDSRIECEHCGRRFQEESIAKHSVICEKVFIKKRKAFNSQRQRAINEEHSKLVEIAQQKFSYYNENQKLNTKWRLRSQQFRAAIELARNPELASKIAQIATEDDRVQCEFCGKKFALTTAERHIPICQQKTLDLKHKFITTNRMSKTMGRFGVSKK